MSALRFEHVSVRYGSQRSGLTAVDDATLTVPSGSVVGLVGESGSGKSTLARAAIGLAPISEGAITLDGADVRSFRRRRPIQMVFQDPFSSLDPRMTIGESIAEALPATCAGPSPPRRGRPPARPREPRRRPGRGPPRRPLRRAAAADRARQGSGGPPRGRHRRRDHLGSRRLRAGLRAQPRPGAAGRARSDDALHLAQPLRRPLPQRPHRGHVPRADRRGRPHRAGARRSAASLHAGAPAGGTHPPRRPAGGRPGRSGRRGTRRPARAALRLPLPPAVPHRSVARSDRQICVLSEPLRPTGPVGAACHFAGSVPPPQSAVLLSVTATTPPATAADTLN